MTKRETRFVTADDLIFVEVRVAGPLGSVDARFVLDTGAVSTTLIPELADAIGYSARDAVRRTKVHSAIGEEDGYVLHVAEFSALGFTSPRFPIHVFDLGHDVSGLLGMNFLSDFNFEIRPAELQIIAERIALNAT